MIAIYAFLILLLFYLLTGYIVLRMVSLRNKTDEPDLSMVEGKPYEPYAEGLRRAYRDVLQMEKKPLRVVSYDGKVLAGDLIECENAKGTIVLFHGYRSCGAMDFGVGVPFYRSLGYNLLIVDQRSHGKSEGRWITFGVKERYDVLSWVTYLGQMLGQEHPVFLGGISMGAATVLMASCFDFPANVRGVIADCGYTTPYEMIKSFIRQRYPKLPAPLVLSALNTVSSVVAGFPLRGASALDAAAEAKCPVLIFHGEADDVVPFEMAKRLLAACGKNGRLIAVKGAYHGQSYLIETARVQQTLADFLEENR